jgi:methylmalonyl-CoA mutase, N-terminal domain
VHTNAYDEALALPTEDSARLALRTQQLLALETGVAAVADPLGGAYAVEALTTEIETRAAALIADVDARGGMVAAIEAGFPQREIERRAFEHQRAVETGARAIVGVNKYASAEDAAAVDGAGGGAGALSLHRLDPALEAAQVARLGRLRAARDAASVARALDAVAQAARGTANLMPPILGAVKARATLGEIADALRAVFGEYQPP